MGAVSAHSTASASMLPYAHLAVHRLQLLQGGDDEHRGLAHAGLGLADHVHAQDGLGDALVLHCEQRGRRGRPGEGCGSAPTGWLEMAVCCCWPAAASRRPPGRRPLAAAAPAAPPFLLGPRHCPPLTLGGVLEAAVLDGAQQLGLEQEVLEATAVDADVALLDLQVAAQSRGSPISDIASHPAPCETPTGRGVDRRQAGPPHRRTCAPSLAASAAVASSSASS